MKFEKLKSGNYRIRKMYKGEMYSVIFDHKPTQKEALQAISAAMDQVKKDDTTLSLETAALRYMEAKSNVLSPSTIRGYHSILKNIPKAFAQLEVSCISQDMLQIQINTYASTHSAKSTANYHGFIIAVLHYFKYGNDFVITLPAQKSTDPYIPTDKDVKKVLKACKGTEYEIALNLAVYGLRLGEIVALKPSDLNGNILSITKDAVLDKDYKLVEKDTPKTSASTRQIYISDYVADLIRENGYILKKSSQSLTRYLKRTEEALGLEHFSIHKLRHYYASMCHSMGIPDAYIQQSGGWSTDGVLKRVYRHAEKDKVTEMQMKAVKHISGLTS